VAEFVQLSALNLIFLDYYTAHWPTAIGKAAVEPRP